MLFFYLFSSFQKVYVQNKFIVEFFIVKEEKLYLNKYNYICK